MEWRRAPLSAPARPTTNVRHQLWVNDAPRWQRFAAVSCAPPPCSHRGASRPPNPPQNAPPARAGAAFLGGVQRGGRSPA
eukprot:14930711-Alexandrium_andersonii.AAC.1